VTQKLSEEQLQWLHFDHVVSKMALNPEPTTESINPSLKVDDMKIEKLSDTEIARFKEFFTNYLEVTFDTNLDEESYFPEEDNILFDYNNKASLQEAYIEDDDDVEKIIPAINDDEIDDELLYLDSLLATGSAELSKDSLSDVFAEILDNEAQQIVNYDSSTFEANIQKLFNEESDEIFVDDRTDELNLPEAPVVNNSIDDLSTNLEVEIPVVSQVTEEIVHTSVEQKEKSKKPKKIRLLIIDVLIFIVFLMITFMVAYIFDILPFDLPF